MGGMSGDHMTLEERDSRCVELHHPGVTYNPWEGKTWCACGAVVVAGDTATHGVACCRGPLDSGAQVEMVRGKL